MQINITKNSRGDIVDVTGPEIPVLLEILEIMNFSASYVEVGINMSYIRGLNDLLRKLQNNELNINVDPMSFSVKYVPLINQVDLEKVIMQLIAVVPVLSTISINIPVHILSYLLIIPLGIVIVIYAANILKIQRNDSFSMLQILFSISLTTHQIMTANRFIFLSIILVSLWYSAGLYADVVDFQLIREIPFDTLESIDESNLKLYVNEWAFDLAFLGDDWCIKILKEKVTQVEDILPCISTLAATNHVCVLEMSLAKICIMALPPKDMENVKIAKPVFNSQRMVYQFERYKNGLRSLSHELLQGYKAIISTAGNMISLVHIVSDLYIFYIKMFPK